MQCYGFLGRVRKYIFGVSAAAYSKVRVRVSVCVCVVADVSLPIDKHTHILRSTPVVFSQLSFRITNTQKTKQKPYKHLGTAVTDAKDANAAHLYQNKQL